MKKAIWAKVVSLVLACITALCMTPAAVYADGEVVTNWATLYTNLGVTNVSTQEGFYDVVSSATNFTGFHVKDIPPTVHHVTDAEGNTTGLDGVILSGSGETFTPGLGSASWSYSCNYGSAGEFIIYPDETVSGYVWNNYVTSLYAVTISDGKTTVGALPWIDFYGESATSGPHYNKVEVAINSGTSKASNQATVHRFDAFFTNGVFNPGVYTVTVYADGFTPLTAQIKVPVNTDASVKVADADVSATETAITETGFPEDYVKVYKLDGTDVTVENGMLKYEGLALKPGSHTLAISDKNDKYVSLSASFLVKTDQAASQYDKDSGKLVPADGATEEDYNNYITNISKVTVEAGEKKDYNATGRGATKIINADGSIDLSKTIAADTAQNVTLTVVSTGYPDLTFTIESEAHKQAVAAATQVLADCKVDASYPADNVKAVNEARAELEKLIKDDSSSVEQINAAADKLKSAMNAAKEAKAKADAEKSTQKAAQSTDPVVGNTYTVGGQKYKVSTASTVTYVASKNAKSVTVPATVTISGKKLDVTAIGSKAFNKKVKTVTVKTMKLTKKSVAGCLKGSKVKTVKVKVGKKKQNKTYLKKYKKFFTKGNAGKKVTVK